MMRIEADEEFLSLFKTESDERLQNLDDGLLRLEASPGDAPTVDALFREAHSLKGAARMLGAPAVAEVMHHFEEILGAARRGTAALAPEDVERLYKGLDGARGLVHEALTGEPAGFAPEALVTYLDGHAETPPASGQGS